MTEWAKTIDPGMPTCRIESSEMCNLKEKYDKLKNAADGMAEALTDLVSTVETEAYIMPLYGRNGVIREKTKVAENAICAYAEVVGGK